MRVLDVVLPERCAVCLAPGRGALPILPRAVDAARPASLRAMWVARPVAGAPLPRVREQTARILRGSRCDRLRPKCPIVRPGLEGAGRRALAREAAALVAEVVARPDVDALVSVPGDPERAWRRGDVPPRRLAVELGRVWNIAITDVLERTRALPHQRGLSLDERRRNVRGSVVVRTSEVPRTACVVDDVYTSGATVDACAAALRKAGTRRVSVVTLTRAVR